MNVTTDVKRDRLLDDIELARSKFHTITHERLENGNVVIGAQLPLPEGWNKTSVSVKFLVPAGYPFGRPEHFYTEPDLRLESGGIPRLSQIGGPYANPFPSKTPWMWHMCHLQSWSTRDTVLTYLHVIGRRLARPS